MKQHTLFWILRRVRRWIPALIIMTAAQIGHALLCVFFALGSRNVIDSAVSGDAPAFYRSCLIQALIIAGILLTLTLVRHLKERLRADLDRDWKQQLLRRLLCADYAAVSGYHSAELLNRLNGDVAKLSDGILSIVPSAASMAARLIAAVAVLGALDARFTGFILLLGILVIGATSLMRRRLKALNKRVSEQDGIVSAFLQEIMEKLLMVQAMDVSGEVQARSDALLQSRYDIQRKRKNVSLLTNSGISLMAYGTSFLALCWCAGRLLAGQITFGGLTAVTQLVSQLQSPFVNLSGILPQYAAMTAAAERLMELEALPAEPAAEMADPHALYEKMTAIGGEDLCFSYDREPVLRGASFSLPRGSFAVVTGPSGMGKSTLLKLLLGIFRPDSGRLYIQCGDEKLPLSRQKRRLFAYVPQGNLLLSGTVRENLTIVRPDATASELQQAVYTAALDDVIASLPDGLDTALGENGAGLSEGQAQRLAIARAVLGGAPVLLLDECTSALDEQTEEIVLGRLKALPGRTCIAVTHRSAAAALADCRLEIADGKIRMMPK